MGHTKNRRNNPKHGSKQFWPRKRAKKMVARVRSWVKSKDVGLQGFVGYKVGMTHVNVKDTRSNSMTKNESLIWPVTVVECPSIKVLSLKFYKKNSFNHLVLVSEIMNPKLDKELAKKIKLPKKQDYDSKIKELESKIGEFYDLRVKIYTQPKKTGIGKKKPEVLELGVGGNNVKDKLDYAKTLFDREIKVSDILKEGIKVDAHAVTIGKGFQGTVKRFGINLRNHKTEKKRRGNILGPESPGRVWWGVKMPGGMGIHLRTEYNKDILFVSSDPEKVNPKGGFLHYGLVKNDYLLIKGSLPGHVKRLITFTSPIRQTKGFGAGINVDYISKESKQ
ncbi:50S ribosomal protein L3 [Candidatus Woesearchaeota archaeon]|nr:50S ribosomal protein L3 [Candidatus Woesearchaeota archaeon]